MKQIVAFFEKVQLRQIITVFLAGITLLITTACNTGDVQGARPDNPPVQAGGMNNPHKGGGDGYTQYKASPNASVNGERDRADLQLTYKQLVAANTSADSGLIYPGSETAGAADRNATPSNPEQARPGGLIQREPNLGERVGERLETVTEAFQDAGSFLKDKASEAQERPELQPNQAKKY